MSDSLDRLKAALADRYTVEREIGRGGTATVYLANDVRHDRPVALKVLNPELAAALGPDRFLQEIKTTARLTNPHILPLLDSGDADGSLFYVMPFVEGESLRERLEKEKQLPLDDALRIAREVADALSHAHDQRVIDRDIEPENILLEAGHAVVADFGIARAIDAAGGERLTETGITVGTPTYMSPEQAGGADELDGRSDLYSLGCVLYEMLAGVPPFAGPTVASLVHQHLTASPPDVTAIRQAVPEPISAAITCLLQKTPADRFGSGAMFAEAVASAQTGALIRSAARMVPAPDRTSRSKRNLALVGAVIGVLAIAVAIAILVWPDGERELEADLVMVVPFENNTGDPGLDQLGDLAGRIISEDIERSGVLRAMPWSTVRWLLREFADAGDYRSTSALGLAAALENRAARLVTGGLYRIDDNVQVRTELIDVASGDLIASLPPDVGSPNQPEALVGTVTKRVLGALAALSDVRLEDYASTAVHVPNYQAYLAYAGGVASHARGEYERAVEQLVRAIELDSTFILPWLQLQSSYANLNNVEARDSAERFIDANVDRLTPYDQWEHRSNMAAAAGDFDAARDAWRRRLEEAPTSQRDRYGWGWAASNAGRHNESMDALLGIDIESEYAKGCLVWDRLDMSIRLSGRHEEGLEYLEYAVRLQPGNICIEWSILQALVYLGRVDEVRARIPGIDGFEAIGNATPARVREAVGRALMIGGHEDVGQAVLEEAIERFRDMPAEESADPSVKTYLTQALRFLERYDDARQVLEGQLRDSPDDIANRGRLGVLAAEQGSHDEALSIQSDLLERPSSRGTNLQWAAMISSALVERDRAVQLLRDAFANGSPCCWHDLERAWQPLRDYEPYLALLRSRD